MFSSFALHLLPLFVVSLLEMVSFHTLPFPPLFLPIPSPPTQGPVVVTTNCLIEPQKVYKDRIYTRGVVGWQGVKHIKDWDTQFPAVVEQALAMPGFPEDKPKNVTTTGYGHNAVLSMAGEIVNAIDTGGMWVRERGGREGSK